MRDRSGVTSVLTLFSGSSDPYYQIRADPAHPAAATFLALWRKEAETHDLVVGKDIPSRRFARFLSHLVVVEPIDNDTDCRVRIVGEAARGRYGRDVAGARFSELFSPTVCRDNLMRLREVRRTGEPIIFDAAIVRDDAPPLCYEVLLLRVLAPDERTLWNVVGIFMLQV